MNSTQSPAPPRKNRGFWTLFLIEMWERFGYYGMAILIVIFLKQYLGFTDSHALLTWGAFTAMVYTTPIIGGWIGDRYLGTRRTTLLGAIVLAIGYFLLAIPGPEWLLFLSFGVIATGNGLFKANPNNLLSQIYESDESMLDGAFTLYYMAINMGSLISQAATPFISRAYGWHWAFAVSAIGLALGIINFIFMKKHLSQVGSKPDFEPFSFSRLSVVVFGTFVVSIIIALVVYNVTVAKFIVFAAAFGLVCLFIYYGAKSNISERNGVIATAILTILGMIFFVFYQQMSTSLTLFALRNVNLNFYGLQITPEQFQILNPFWIFVLSPILAYVYNRLGQDDSDLDIASKFTFGFFLLAVGFFIYGLSGYFSSDAIVSAWWMVAGYFFQSFGELLISGLGLAMVSRFIKNSLRGVFMGAWLLVTGISQFIGSMVANIASVPDKVGEVLQLVPASSRSHFIQLPQNIQHTISNLDLGAFRYWIDSSPVNSAALHNAPKAIQQKFQGFQPNVQDLLHKLPSFSSLSAQTKQALLQINETLHHATLPLYTHLFIVLGIAAIGATIISAVIIPVIKRLEGKYRGTE